MQQGIWALVVGLIGGAIGAVLITYVVKPGGDGASSASGGDLRGDPAVLERLTRIEEMLETRGLITARLEGRSGSPGAPTDLEAEADLARLEAGLVERMDKVFEEAIQPRIDSAMEAKWEELKGGEGEEEGPPGRRGRKRMALADVAREVGLSAGDEAELRRIYADAENRMYELFAKPDGDVEQVRRDLEAFKSDKTQRPKLMGKYIPKMIQNVGEVMAIEQEKNERVVEAVGAETAEALSGYAIEEANPIDLNAEMRLESGGGR